MKFSTLLLTALLALVFVTMASAHFGGPYVTEAQTETMISNSTWADKNNVDDAFCEGQNKAHKDDAGEPTYKHFLCEFEQTVSTHYQGEVTCTFTAKLHTLSPTSFKVTDKTSRNCPFDR